MTFCNTVQNNFKIVLISRHKYILSWQHKVGGGFETHDVFSDATLQCFLEIGSIGKFCNEQRVLASIFSPEMNTDKSDETPHSRLSPE